MKLVEHLADAAEAAGALLRARASAPREIETKSSSVDLVTDADPKAEALVVDRLSSAFPGARFVLEEGGEAQAPGSGNAALTFVVDPLDGTTNFASKIPHYAVNIGVERDGERVAACTYDVCRGELFLAERGSGAFVNGQRMRVSNATQLDDAVLATGFAYLASDDLDDNHTEFAALNLTCRGVRRFGAAALDLAWVAAGRFDGYWERKIQPWDICPGILLVEEAGGRTSRYDGEAVGLGDREVIASNGALHDALKAAVSRARSMLAK